MILYYDNGTVSRVRLDFSDLPNLPALSTIANKATALADRMENERKLLVAATEILPLEQKYSVLSYQDNKVWLTIL